jgi:hypothetical protein
MIDTLFGNQILKIKIKIKLLRVALFINFLGRSKRVKKICTYITIKKKKVLRGAPKLKYKASFKNIY